MPENRFYLNTPFHKNDQVLLQDEELHHLRVMRIAPGQTIELVNGQNQLAHATLDTLERREARVTLQEIETLSPPRPVTLAMALLKPKNLELVIEKGTELGATSFLLFPGEKSERSTLSHTQLARLRALTISALKQCGRLDLPHLELRPPLSSWTIFPPDGYFASLKAKNFFTPPSTPLTLYVGPESGFTPAEEALLASHAQGIRLHPNTLRAETAALAFLSKVKF